MHKPRELGPDLQVWPTGDARPTSYRYYHTPCNLKLSTQKKRIPHSVKEFSANGAAAQPKSSYPLQIIQSELFPKRPPRSALNSCCHLRMVAGHLALWALKDHVSLCRTFHPDSTGPLSAYHVPLSSMSRYMIMSCGWNGGP